jgi:hypothetical protein
MRGKIRGGGGEVGDHNEDLGGGAGGKYGLCYLSVGEKFNFKSRDET